MGHSRLRKKEIADVARHHFATRDVSKDYGRHAFKVIKDRVESYVSLALCCLGDLAVLVFHKRPISLLVKSGWV